MRRFDFFLPLKMTLGTLEVVQTWVQLQRKYRLRPIVEERGGALPRGAKSSNCPPNSFSKAPFSSICWSAVNRPLLRSRWIHAWHVNHGSQALWHLIVVEGLVIAPGRLRSLLTSSIH